VGVQLLLLALLAVVVFLVPITAAQVSDVLRAWGDKPLSRAATGVAGALLLGAVCRASATRLLVPVQWADRWTAGGWRIALPAAALVALAFGLLHLWPALVMVLVIVAVGAATRWSPPQQPDDALGSRLRRLAGTLGVVPLAIVFAGLSSALVDTLLLPSSLTDADLGLLTTTLVVGLALAVLAAYAHPPADWDPLRWKSAARWYVGPIGLSGCILAFLAGSGGTVGDVASVLLALGAAALAFWVLPDRAAPRFWGAGGAALGMIAAVYADPIGAPRALGTLGVALLGIAGMLVLLHLAAAASARRVPRGVFRQPWLPKHVPLVTLLIVWGVAAWIINDKANETVHQARTVSATSAPGPIDDAVAQWLDREATGSPDQVPMLLVAASGGGAKAAYWTDLVLDCVFGEGAPASGEGGECDPPQGSDRLARLFLTSSVSGGSVGVYHLVRHRRRAQAWVDAAAGPEVLSPAVAWGLLHDLPAFMIGMHNDPRRCVDGSSCRRHADRALVQEAAVANFENGIVPPKGGGLLEARADGAPVTVFNGALDGADGRVLLSPLSLAPPRSRNPVCRTPWTGEPAAGSVDGHDMLNVQREQLPQQRPRRFVPVPPYNDVPFVTAALLSARFPIVSPAARLGDTKPRGKVRGCDMPATLPPVQIRDGGYVENSGVLTIVDLLPALDRAVQQWKTSNDKEDLDVPFIVVSIDDDPAVIGGDPELEEAPRDSLGISKRAGPGYLTRMSRDRLESCQHPNVHYVRISPAPHTGAQAATGWELSRTTREEDLAAALADGQRAGEAVQKLRDALEGGLSANCPAR
jgi:hypothetical protein